MSTQEVSPLSMGITEDDYNLLQQAALADYGTSLEALAEEDPYTVYRFIRGAILANSPDVHGLYVTHQSGVTVDSENDGLEAARGAAESSVEQFMPLVVVKPVQVFVITSNEMAKE